MSEEYEWLKANYEKGMHLGNFLKKFEEHFNTEFFKPPAPLGIKDLELVSDKIELFRRYLEERLIIGRVPRPGLFYYWTKNQEEGLKNKDYSALEFYEEFGVPRSQGAIDWRKEEVRSRGVIAPEAKISPGTTLDSMEWNYNRLKTVLRSLRTRLQIEDLFIGNEGPWHKDETIFILFFKDEENIEEIFYDRFLKHKTKKQMLEHLREYKEMLSCINNNLPEEKKLTKRGSKRARYEEEL